jgi:hypothetical protein
VSIIPVDHPAISGRLPGDLVRGVLESLCGIVEIDTDALYRVMRDRSGEELNDLVYPVAWVDESLGGSIPRVKVRDAKTGEESLVPSMLLEKLSPLEALGEQAE